MGNSWVEIPLNFVYSKQEFEIIRQGFVPKSMDDRWFIYVKDGHIFFHRSWTGVLIYDCFFEESEHEIIISSMHANRDTQEYLNLDCELDTSSVKQLLDQLFFPNFFKKPDSKF